MVGLVLVSHSRLLAEGLLQLAHQIAPPEVKIAIAAGVGEDHQELGTDALDILAAIRSVYSEQGVIVLMDLGSAVLSAEMALEFLGEEERQRVRLCPAPLVEGTLAALAQCAVNSDPEQICAEALRALTAKQTHLASQLNPSPNAQIAVVDSLQIGPDEVVVRLENPHGLHARPATQFIQTVARFDARVWVANLDRNTAAVEAVSLNALLALEATQGQRLRLTAQGRQASEVLTALQELIAAWGHDWTSSPSARKAVPATVATAKAGVPQYPAAHDQKTIHGLPIADGIAIAPIHFLQTSWIEPASRDVASPDEEWHRLQDALQKVASDLHSRYQHLRDQLGEDQAAIFQAQQFFLRDPLLLQRARQAIYDERQSAAQSWKTVCDEIIQSFQQAEDAYLRQRVLDILDISRIVLNKLWGKSGEAIHLPEAAILAADELTPNQVAELDGQAVQGVILSGGGITSHSAILLRGLGIPTIGGVDLMQLGVKDGDWVGMDGASGVIWLQPSSELKLHLEEKVNQWKANRQRLLHSAQQPAHTRDGKRVEILANVGSLAEGKLARTNGAEGIGVLRTEFLFQNRLSPPDEQEQVGVYLQIAELIKPYPLVIRTLDVGGDKLPAYLSLPAEANPYLGLRGIRVSLHYPDLFQTQLRAILRAAKAHPICLLLPMIATMEEVEQAQTLVAQVHEQLVKANFPHAYPIPIGIMIETPASVLLAEHLSKLVDFFSIGTNDLTQYTLAAERGNPSLRNYHDALHPAVLRQIEQVISAAHVQGKRVTVCGEVASDPQALPILIGLGSDELSMSPNAIPQQKAILATIDSEIARSLASEALHCRNAPEVRQLVQKDSKRN
ncbi:MAG: phosphoenolpyruvate--protein phosphotransferase [Anaerolineales bacterium]